jgi:hypothetical protein
MEGKPLRATGACESTTRPYTYTPGVQDSRTTLCRLAMKWIMLISGFSYIRTSEAAENSCSIEVPLGEGGKLFLAMH